MEGIQSPKKERFPEPTVELEDVKTPEEFLRAVDFNALNDIFDALEDKSGGERPSKNTGYRVDPDKITIVGSLRDGKGELYGAARVDLGTITVVGKEESGETASLVRTISLLRLLMHEAAHVRGGHKREYYEESEEVRRFILRGGLRENLYEIKQGRVDERAHGLSLNEAVTETLGQQVLREYLIRVGKSGYFKNKELSREVGIGSYVADRYILEMVIGALAQKLETDKQDIWRAFVRAYMDGNTDIEDLLNQITTQLSEIPVLNELIEKGAIEALGNRLNLNDTIDRLPDAELSREAFDRITAVLDVRRFKDVLGLR
jgi:hypothetical protein